jgi:malate/lactate dehydrogenase
VKTQRQRIRNCQGSDLVINTAAYRITTDGAIPTRELLAQSKITDAVAEGIKKYCSKAIIISVANPLMPLFTSYIKN